MRYFIFFIILLMFSPGVAAIQADEDPEQEIRSLLESRDQEIKDLLGPRGEEHTAEQREQLRDIINDVIDFRAMAQQALGSTYDEITDEQREEFVSLFATIIRDQSLNRLDIYRAEVTYEDIEVENGEAKAHTIARLENVRTPVNYVMKKDESEWVITDMVIDEVSTADSYNRQFQSIIRQRGFDALLDSLRRRAART